ncbi:MAG: triose-phosphate isomerase [Deltaproteobacteria bacterium]|nr:triose-phosphate isomerase [Deltaproteobacteria bacterium]
MKKPVIAANWKMHKTIAESADFARSLKAAFPKPQGTVIIAPAFTALAAVGDVLKGSAIHLAAQNLHWEEKGAFTGEIAAAMLVDAGCDCVIIGHSERRAIFKETGDWINRKVAAALRAGLTPILCVGETLEEREKNLTFPVVERQLKEALNNISSGDIKLLSIAYEPVWAIGTGRNATAIQAEEVHRFIRTILKDTCGEHDAADIPLIYGGSVKPGNTGKLLAEPDIDGALVGGASLDFDSFAAIIQNASKEKGN